MNLLLIRASGRAKESAVRQALGAGWNLVSEVVVETTLLTFAGGLLGLAVGAGGIRLLRALGADRLPLGSRIVFDARLALVGLVGAIVMGFVLAAPIAWFNLRGHLGNALQSVTRGGTSGRGAQFLRHSFIVSQIALAFVLLVGAGLLGLSLQRVMAVSPGFRSDHVLTGEVLLPWADYGEEGRVKFVRKLAGQNGSGTGRVAAGVVNNVPFSGNSGKSAATVKGHVSAQANPRADTILTESPATISRDGFLPAGRSFPHRRRFTSRRTGLRSGRRLRAILLAARQRDRPTTVRRLRRRKRCRRIHRRRRRWRGETSGTDRS